MNDHTVSITTDPNDGDGPMLSREDTALLMGITADELHACVMAQREAGVTRQNIRIPKAWIEQGRSRADIYRQVTGRDDMRGAIEFWRALA